MSATGGNGIFTLSFTNDVAMTQHRAVLPGAGSQHIKLPTGNNPSQLPLGIALDGNASGKPEAVRMIGIEYLEVNGTATAGKQATVLNTGKGTDIVTNATPVQQTVIGVWMDTGVTGDLCRVFIQPMFVTL